MDTRTCPRCNKDKPLTKEYFYQAKWKRYGFQYECKECKKIRDKTYKSTSEKAKRYSKSPRFVFSQLQHQAKKRKIIFELTLEYYLENLANKPCKYCGSTNTKHWIDRIIKDHTIGYTKENSAPCCELCNKMKMALSEQFFIDHCKAVAKFNS